MPTSNAVMRGPVIGERIDIDDDGNVVGLF
jgi:hypothetical protein